ncbi:MAG: endo-1,4-beta-xylanase [Verrucomicrobiae bacterium]|nr:endo-1,4-beta-xylanase [Verrucomicrobiae bacterium]MCX7721770.1 endo-1,4-beta-xylanase [Verrucomicrobiae bacterium]
MRLIWSFRSRAAVAALALSAALTVCAQPALKDAFEGVFLIGAALNEAQFTGRDTNAVALIKTHFNSVTAENVLKWQRIHPEPGVYEFELADKFVEFGVQNGMVIIGHTLVWHHQTPRWVFRNEDGSQVDRDTLLARMREHIHTVVGRYKGRIKGWDVVNEALDEDGRLRQTPWLRIIGDDYIAKAFEFAHEADPEAELYYNDFSLENKPKRDGAVALIKRLKAQGIPITGVGLQGHYTLNWPSKKQLAETIRAFSELGLKVMITELDVDVLPRADAHRGADLMVRYQHDPKLNPYTAGLPDSVQRKLAKRYADIFDVLVRHSDAVTRVTFWGVTDRDSWLNYWPMPGRTNHPLLFDRHYQPKPAFYAVLTSAEKAKKSANKTR